MKLLEYLQKIKSGKIFRAVLVGDVPVAHTVEFQKNGLPHAHILVWQKKDNDEVITPDFSSSFVSTMGSELSDVDDDAPATALIKAMESALAEPPGLKTSSMPWPSLLSPSLLKTPSARTSEDCFVISVFKYLSLHPFKQPTTVFLPCLETQPTDHPLDGSSCIAFRWITTKRRLVLIVHRL